LRTVNEKGLGSRVARNGRSFSASWSWSALVAVATTTFLPLRMAGTRYAKDFPVPVPA
jgi:hypothetical protein